MSLEFGRSMKPRLISYTKPCIPEVDTPVDLIAFCARVSNPANQLNKDTADRLVRYLIRHRHWSPLEMVDATFEIETTRDITRQLIRHRSFVFQEFSQRYAEAQGYRLSEARLQDEKNRQNSLPCIDEELQEWWEAAQREVIDLCDVRYREALGRGIAKELARKILPEGLTLSRVYMKGSLRSWIHYCGLRGGNGTQREHVEIAVDIARIISEIFPLPDLTPDEYSNN